MSGFDIRQISAPIFKLDDIEERPILDPNRNAGTAQNEVEIG